MVEWRENGSEMCMERVRSDEILSQVVWHWRRSEQVLVQVHLGWWSKKGLPWVPLLNCSQTMVLWMSTWWHMFDKPKLHITQLCGRSVCRLATRRAVFQRQTVWCRPVLLWNLSAYTQHGRWVYRWQAVWIRPSLLRRSMHSLWHRSCGHRYWYDTGPWWRWVLERWVLVWELLRWAASLRIHLCVGSKGHFHLVCERQEFKTGWVVVWVRIRESIRLEQNDSTSTSLMRAERLEQ